MVQLLTYICYKVHLFIFRLFRLENEVVFPLNQLTLFTIQSTHACPISGLLDKYKGVHNVILKKYELFFPAVTLFHFVKLWHIFVCLALIAIKMSVKLNVRKFDIDRMSFLTSNMNNLACYF